MYARIKELWKTNILISLIYFEDVFSWFLTKERFFLYELSNAACLIWYVVIKAVINY